MEFLSLGEHPPSNSFITPEQIAVEQRYPLSVYVCEECHLVQLLDVVPAETIFSEYAYLSSASRALRDHYEDLTRQLRRRLGLEAGDLVVDIGCNDGIMLNAHAEDLVRVGVEPSDVAEVARADGFDICQEFFNVDTAKRLVDQFGQARCVTATNVFAHVDDISAFTAGIPELLGPDGVFVVEASYLIDLIDQVLFDTIYHEHLCYYSLTPMVPFFDRHGLEIFDVERVGFGASGPAIRVFAQRSGGPHAVKDSVDRVLAYEESWGVGRLEAYADYSRRVEGIRDEALTLIDRSRSSGARVGGYGAPAKGNTLLNYFGLNAERIEYIADTNVVKQGRVTPGSHIPIISEEEFLERMPEYALLLTWNYLDFFLERSRYIEKGGTFIVPVPVPRLAPVR